MGHRVHFTRILAKIRLILGALGTLTLAAMPAASAAPAQPPSCANLPRLSIAAHPSFCVGIVAKGFKSPRGVQPLANGDIVVVDMGGWQSERGSIWLLRPAPNGYDKHLLFDRLDRPGSAALGPDGLVYVGMPGRVVRFDPGAARSGLTDVIGGFSSVSALPGEGRHSLPSLLFDGVGNLLVNVGSASDHCEVAAEVQPDPVGRCLEGEGPQARGVIRKYLMHWPGGHVQSWDNYAFGLRNSMAMAIQPTGGALWQAENARDGINAAIPGLKNDDELPHDELNLIEAGGHYGWPYCYDNQQASPEYPLAECSRYLDPARLLPAHAAPLGMVFYTGTGFPAKFSNSLIISYHGYRKHGHRVVALLADGMGRPLGASIDLIAGKRRKGDNGMGAPVAVKLGPDGNVYLTDDHSGTVLMLHYEAMQTSH